MPSETTLASGLVERIGLDHAQLHYRTEDVNISEDIGAENHTLALKAITNLLMDADKGVIKDVSDIPAIGHRVVHGGDVFTDTVEIDESVKSKIKDFFDLAPLHNPPNLEGIEVAEKLFPQAKQIAVFDTAFHSSIPKKAAQYAIPTKFYEEHHIQVYGFHGTSHNYVTNLATKHLKKDESKLISIHLGNGCSMTAVKDGKSIDHSMGFTPLDGLIMGTRSGSIDPSVIFHMVDKLGYSFEEVSKLLQKESGMLGLTGYSDLREIEKEAENGNRQCQLALEMNAYRIKKYIGSYIAAMNGVDAIIFTAGIGENSDVIRRLACKEMDFFGIVLDEEKNKVRAKEVRFINKEEAKVKVMVIPTNEELEIAQQTYNLVF
ncbi:acetate kinase [Salegentibacter echinorum]|uniref:Acetate kinase n=2 Tax=Salegentibacter echinorum TaxID=1073325 RepID=A0A1M5C7A9_SALEC|nr:acetate kinase [Salegentibacter echinorum]